MFCDFKDFIFKKFKRKSHDRTTRPKDRQANQQAQSQL